MAETHDDPAPQDNPVTGPTGHSHDGDVMCAICGHDYDFDLPAPLLQAAKEGRLVIFAGAGISTEGGTAFPSTLYDEIRAQLPEESVAESFPAVMSEYEEMHGRLALVEEIIKRLRYAENFPAVRSVASRFHDELASITPIRDIITTNWDNFFEDECGAVPIVVDGDYAFYNLPDRKVYKIHGSLRNVSTVIATTADYLEAEASLRESAVGGTLRHLLATKVVVFIGYSLRDDDFRNVYEPLMDGMGKLRPLSYFVGPYESPEAEGYGLRQLQTDGTHFLRVLKSVLVDEGVLLPDHAMVQARRLAEVALRAHMETSNMDWRTHPEILYSIAYQDGLLDALNRIASQWRTGEYADRKHVLSVVHSYEHLLHVAIDRERYWDAAYIDGYGNGVLALLMELHELSAFPLYQFFEHPFFYGEAYDEGSEEEGDSAESEDGLEQEDAQAESADSGDDHVLQSPEILTQEELIERLSGAFDEIPAARVEAERHIEGIPGGMVPQHTPFLDGVIDYA